MVRWRGHTLAGPNRQFHVRVSPMTKIELAIKALDEVPEDRREEVADLILTIVANAKATGSVLTEEQRAEVRRRQAEGFEPGDPDHIDKLIARLS